MRITIPAHNGVEITVELDEDQTMELYAELRAHDTEAHYQEWLARQAFPDNIVPIRPDNPLHLLPCEEDNE